MKKNILVFVIALFFFNTFAQDGKYVETNGVKIYYEEYGNGEPLLLIHGFMLSHKEWKPWIEILSKNYKVITPDLRGHGYSTNPTDSFSTKLAAQDFYGLMDSLKINKFKAIGHSAGSISLLQMALMDTSRIEAMILIGATNYFPDGFRAICKNTHYETLSNDWRSVIEPHQPGGEEQIKKIVMQFRKFADDYSDVNFSNSQLSTIKSKTLIIHGDRDAFFPIENPIYLYSSIPDSYLWILTNVKINH